jgi:hypothetical protein
MLCTWIQEVSGLSLGQVTSCREIFVSVCPGRRDSVGAVLLGLHAGGTNFEF